MIFEELKLAGSYLIKPKYFSDKRGSFGRLLCKDEFEEQGLSHKIVQVNHSINSTKGSVRGMHYQKPPYCEVKVIKCIKGSVWDVIVDIRKGSSTFLQWTAVELSAANQKMIYVPQGFAHGFQVLESDSELLYMHTEMYTPGYEGALNYCDSALNINWPLPITEISEKDSTQPVINVKFKGLNL
jgi:dTDP-4-dehydrorhamnose 3,5-epimerase